MIHGRTCYFWYDGRRDNVCPFQSNSLPFIFVRKNNSISIQIRYSKLQYVRRDNFSYSATSGIIQFEVKIDSNWLIWRIFDSNLIFFNLSRIFRFESHQIWFCHYYKASFIVIITTDREGVSQLLICDSHLIKIDSNLNFLFKSNNFTMGDLSRKMRSESNIIRLESKNSSNSKFAIWIPIRIWIQIRRQTPDFQVQIQIQI